MDFSRDRSHTTLLANFCEDNILMPIVKHSSCMVDYSYHFNMARFSILDHFILSQGLFDNSVESVSSVHDVDNLSDHETICLVLRLDVDRN